MLERKKYTLLKELELYIYRVAFYLLNDQEPAVEVSKRTIRTLAENKYFYDMEKEKRLLFARSIAIRKSLSLKADLLSNANLLK